MATEIGTRRLDASLRIAMIALAIVFIVKAFI